jgi:ABC-type uncharacterized transport system YnjBCD permease subunit
MNYLLIALLFTMALAATGLLSYLLKRPSAIWESAGTRQKRAEHKRITEIFKG